MWKHISPDIYHAWRYGKWDELGLWPKRPAWVHPYDRPSQRLRGFVAENNITNPLALAILRSMAEIDAEITHVDEDDEDEDDRPPEGQDYNDLWDVVLDAIRSNPA